MENLEQLVTKAGSDHHPLEREEAFTELVRRFQDMAFGCAYARLGDLALAEDAAQEAFIAAYRGLPKLREPGAFPSWLKRIVVRQCNRFIRARRLELAPLEGAMGVPAAQLGPAELSEALELKNQVRAAISSLPEQERLATTLFYISGHSMKEVSAFLGITESTVTNRLRMARKRLKERLIDMVRDHLQAERPSRNDRFAKAIRHAVEQDWEPVLQLTHQVAPFDREGNEHWLEVRKAFDESNRARRHYAANDPGTEKVAGYGSIEQQDPDPHRYRMYVVASPERLEDVGALLYEKLLGDLDELKATSVWVREPIQEWPPAPREKRQLDFFAERGFTQTRLVWDLYQPLDAVDWSLLHQARQRLAAQGIAITTLEQELEQNPECLQKQADLFNAWRQDQPGAEPLPLIPVQDLVSALAERPIFADGCFIAKDGEEYVGSTWLRGRQSKVENFIGAAWREFAEADKLEAAMTGVLPDYRHRGIATALKMCAAEWARDQGRPAIHAFNDDVRNREMLAINERVGFQRRIGMVVMEKKLRA